MVQHGTYFLYHTVFLICLTVCQCCTRASVEAGIESVQKVPCTCIGAAEVTATCYADMSTLSPSRVSFTVGRLTLTVTLSPV